jgi:hypothetical protein
MALFSRRKTTPPAETPAQGVEPGEQPVDDPATEAGAPREPGEHPATAEPSPEVTISLSEFRGVGAAMPPVAPEAAATPPEGAASAASARAATSLPPRRPVPAEAPAPTSTLPGLRDNVLLVQALAALPAKPGGAELMNVARQLLQGHLFLRVQGDARALLSAGKALPLSIATLGEKRYVLAYSGGAAIQESVRADGDTKTSAMGQPVLAVLGHVLAGEYEGLILDNNSSPARAVLPREILQRAVDQADKGLRIKTLLAEPRTDATATEIALALTEAPLWIAVKRPADGGPVGVAETRTAEGERFLEVFSHPLESVALARGDAAAPITAAQLANALTRDPQLTGLLVDPAGPWIRLTRDDLAPLLALAP